MSENQTKLLGVKLYSVVLNLNPLSHMFHSYLFNSILSLSIQGIQALENSASLTKEQIQIVECLIEYLPFLKRCFCDEFVQLAGVDSLIALIELPVKSASIFSKDKEIYIQEMRPIANNLLIKAAELFSEHVIPFVVHALLFGYSSLPNSQRKSD